MSGCGGAVSDRGLCMEILGHSQIALTMSTYTHVVPDLRKDAAARLESLFGERER